MRSMDEIEQIERALGDDSAWEQPDPGPRKKSERRQRGAMVSVRLTPDELEMLQAASGRQGVSMAAYMRDRALRDLNTQPILAPVRSINMNRPQRTVEPPTDSWWLGLNVFHGPVLTESSTPYGP